MRFDGIRLIAKLLAEIGEIVKADDYLVGIIIGGKLACPKCKRVFAETGDFRHLSDMVEHREVDEIVGSTLKVEGMCERYEESDGNDRLECRNDGCMVEFALPEGMTFEYF